MYSSDPLHAEEMVYLYYYSLTPVWSESDVRYRT